MAYAATSPEENEVFVARHLDHGLTCIGFDPRYSGSYSRRFPGPLPAPAFFVRRSNKKVIGAVVLRIKAFSVARILEEVQQGGERVPVLVRSGRQ